MRGRLFWKLFLFIWLGQMAGVVGTGAIFWLERESGLISHDRLHAPPAPPGPPGPGGRPGGPPPFGPGGGPRPLHIPYAHLTAGLLASLLCAAGIAWYFARPIRRLREAFNAAAEGRLEVRIGERMGHRRDELSDLGHDFDRMSERLRSLMEGQKRLLHDVSHELRSPLARLHAAIGLARQQPERIDDTLLRIEREGERMNRLVGELLTLSRLEAGVAGALEPVALAELLDGLIDDACFEAGARQLAVDAAPLPDLTVMANPELLHRAIENVVRNALHHSPPGGTVGIALTALDGGQCRIRVTDEGPGVPESQLETIFTPFFRSEDSAPPLRKEKREGYGLGLAIAQRVVHTLNGRIVASNRPAGGLQVDIELPQMAAAG